MTSQERQRFIDLAMALAEHARRTPFPDVAMFYARLIGAWVEVAGSPTE